MKGNNLHKNTLVIDTHNDVLSYLQDNSTWLPKLDLTDDLKGLTKYGHVDINKLKEGGVNAAFFAVFAPESYYPGKTLDRALALINALYFNVQNHFEELKLFSGRPEDLESLDPANDELLVIPSMEGMDMIKEDEDLLLLSQLYDLNVGMVSLTWNDSNHLAEGLNSKYPDGSTSHKGLTSLGKKVIQELNRLGIIIDVSHLHKRSYWEVLECSKVPVMASHSGACGVYEHRRNFTDEELKALAENGGVIQINFARDFLCSREDKSAGVSKIVDHIEHVVDLVGVWHVGLGSDFDGAQMPQDMEDASCYPCITDELLKRGFSEWEIKKILGENTLRLMKEIRSNASVTHKIADTSELEFFPHFEMGTVFEEKEPLLGVTINEYEDEIREDSIKIIMDGRIYEPDSIDSWTHPHLSKSSKAVYFTPKAFTEDKEYTSPGGFHVVSFRGENGAGEEISKTAIYYITR